MAKKLYAEVGGVSSKVKKVYAEVGGVSHRVKKIYAEVVGASRLVFLDPSTYFSKYEQSMGNLIGSYSIKEDGSGMTASLTNAYTGGANLGCRIGWMIENLPAGAVVDVGYTYTKQAYPMNDIIVSSESGVLATHSEVGTYSFVLSTERHTGWILFMIDFFPYSSTSTSLTITSLTVNGERLWTAVS